MSRNDELVAAMADLQARLDAAPLGVGPDNAVSGPTQGGLRALKKGRASDLSVDSLAPSTTGSATGSVVGARISFKKPNENQV